MDDIETNSRNIALDGAYNFRDLGGIPVAGGRVKQGLLFRSDDLSDLTEPDLKRLKNMNLTTVIDFRDRGESMFSRDRLPESVKITRQVIIEAGRVMGMYSDGNLNHRKSMSLMVSVYRVLPLEFQRQYTDFFKIVAEAESAPLLFHCAAGKDRTGVAAALLLSALGADRQTAMQDYMVSRERLARKYKAGIDYGDDLEPLYSVYPEFLEAPVEVIDNLLGCLDSNLQSKLGLDRESLRARYVALE